jgi:hypothetical protein
VSASGQGVEFYERGILYFTCFPQDLWDTKYSRKYFKKCIGIWGGIPGFHHLVLPTDLRMNAKYSFSYPSSSNSQTGLAFLSFCLEISCVLYSICLEGMCVCVCVCVCFTSRDNKCHERKDASFSINFNSLNFEDICI